MAWWCWKRGDDGGEEVLGRRDVWLVLVVYGKGRGWGEGGSWCGSGLSWIGMDWGERGGEMVGGGQGFGVGGRVGVDVLRRGDFKVDLWEGSVVVRDDFARLYACCVDGGVF